MTRVLALDLSGSTGWACGSTEGTPVSHGICKLPKTGEDLGRYLAHFRDWLNAAIDEMEPDQIIFEAPIMPQGGVMSIISRRKLFSLAGVVELVAHDRKIPVTEAFLQSIRVHFIGTAAAPSDIKAKEVRRMWLKNAVVNECKRRGFRVSGDDDADAIALLSLRLSQLDANYSLKATPLFGAAA